MQVFAFTGQISSGKTTQLNRVKDFLLSQQKTVKTFFADDVAKTAYSQEPEASQLSKVLSGHQKTDIFVDIGLRKLVESIIHPFVYSRLKEIISEASFDYLLVEVPILKPERVRYFDKIFYLTADFDTRKKLALQRGMTEDQFIQRDEVLSSKPKVSSDKLVVISDSIDFDITKLLSKEIPENK